MSVDDEIRTLLASDDEREVLVGLDLVADLAPSGFARELTRLADDDRPDVRLVALSRLPDASARTRLREEMKWALEASDVQIKRAALDAVGHGDREHVMAVIVALMDPTTAGAAAGALERLGDLAAPAVKSILARAKVPAPAYAARIVRCTRFSGPLRESVLAPHASHADRELGLAVLQSLASNDNVTPSLAAVLEGVITADVEHERRIVAMRAAVEPGGDARLLRALDDELDLIRQRIACGMLARGTTGPDIEQSEAVKPRSVAEAVQELVDDPDDVWRSPWLRDVAIASLAR